MSCINLFYIDFLIQGSISLWSSAINAIYLTRKKEKINFEMKEKTYGYVYDFLKKNETYIS